MEMRKESAKVLLVSMPFAGVNIPSIQLPLLAAYLRKKKISVDEAHLYLKAADIYGVIPYAGLIAPPNDSYTAQLAFTKYVFPQHWKDTQGEIQAFYEQKNPHLQKKPLEFSFDRYISCSDALYLWMQKNINWKPYDIIGFTLNYGQFLPSLAVAKFIKQRYHDKTIVFGGSRTTGELGKHILKTFDYLDYIVSGEGEEALYQLAAHPQHYKKIPTLIYRTKDDVHWNSSQQHIDMNTLPVPCYDQFYMQLQNSSPEVQQYYQYHGRLPVEISRGCWWNKCSFCNLNIQHKSYREKNIGRILEEITTLSDKYKAVTFELIGNTLPKQHYTTLCQRLKDLGKDLFLFVEARAGQMKQNDYHLLREAGFTTIQTGIESFSAHYLKTMNKGARVIDNIAALKYCKENGIQNAYNLIVNYPNEKPLDFEETQHVVQMIQSYLDPPNLCQLRVLFGSPIYRHPEQFNIRSLEPAPIDKLLFPQEILDQHISFVYDVTQLNTYPEHNWEELVQTWKNTRQQMMIEAVQQPTQLNHYVYYYIDGGSFIKIYDKRNQENIQIFTLDDEERRVFLACLDVISFDTLHQHFSEMPEYKLAAMLHTFEKNGIVFKEDEYYLSLPLSINKISGHSKRREENKNLILQE